MQLLITAALVLDIFLDQSGIEALDPTAARQSKVIAGLVVGSVIVVSLLIGLAKESFRRSPRRRGVGPVAALLAAWMLWAAIAAVQGGASHNAFGYLIGDFYKFSLLPLWFGLLYLSWRTPEDVDRAVVHSVVVLGIAVLYDIVRFLPDILAGDRLATSATYRIVAFVPLIGYAVFKIKPGGKTRVVLITAAVVNALGLFLIQGLSGFLLLIVCVLLYLVAIDRWRIVALLLAPVVFAGFAFFTLSTERLIASASVGGAYAQRKIEFALTATNTPDLVFRLSGIRLLQIDAIWNTLQTSWARVLFGTGMGGVVELDPNWTDQYGIRWRAISEQHFVESAFAEVLYRAGLVAVFTLVLTFWYCWKVARDIRNVRPGLSVLGAVNALYLQIGLCLVIPLSLCWYPLCLTAVGTIVTRAALDDQSDTARPSEDVRRALAS